MNKTLKTACLNFESGLVDELEAFVKTALDAPGTAYPAGKPVSAPGSAPTAAPKTPAPPAAPKTPALPEAPRTPAQKTENRTFSQKDGKWFSGDKPASDDEVRQITEYQAKQKAEKPADKPAEKPAKTETNGYSAFFGGSLEERAAANKEERDAANKKTQEELDAKDNPPQKKQQSIGEAANQIDSKMTAKEKSDRDARAEAVKGQVKETRVKYVSNPYAPTSDTMNESMRRSEEAKAREAAEKAKADARAKVNAPK